MTKNKIIRKKDHPIRYEIACLQKHCAQNSEKIKLISQGLLGISLCLVSLYGMTKIPDCIDSIQLAQAKNRERSYRRFEEMPAAERNRYLTQEQQDRIFEQIRKGREKNECLYRYMHLKRMEKVRSKE